MKTSKLLILICAISLNTVFAQKNIETASSLSHLEGPYLGQKPPGLMPEPFAPGIVSTERYEYCGVFTPDMKEFYFIKGDEDNKKQEFVRFQYKNNRWHESVISPRVGQPFISPDGKTMHLGRRYMERTEDGWSERKSLGLPFKDILIMRLSASANGTYYFDTYDENKSDFPIRYSRLIDGKHENPKSLSKEINTGTQLNHPFIAPDESYLIWDAKRDGGYGGSDIYISFRAKDGSWGTAINLGDKINTDGWDAAASVSPDGKYIFFHRTISPGNEDTLPNVDIFWVDAQIIETLRPKSFGQNLPKLVHVEGGTFTMGDESGLSNKDQRPTHEVTVKGFDISQTEVTVAQYRYYCNATGVAMPKEPSWGWQDNSPIVNVSWRDAINYADWLSDELGQKVRLPYEAEWEYAARGGNRAKGYKYSGANNIDNVSWYGANSNKKTNAVASKKANELGLYDMSGNVWEWCMDRYGGDYYANSPKNNPKGAAKGESRVIRGGSWSLDATFCSLAYRYGSTFDGELYDYFGFRVASVKKQ